jgi:hypothetical protein
MTDVPDLRLRFVLRLEREKDFRYLTDGVAFHRWLPNGPEDAIELQTGHSGSTLRVWFKRMGFVEPEGELPQVRYALNREELTDAAIVVQGRLSSGPLFGEVLTDAWTRSEWEAVRNRNSGSAEYIALARRVLDILIPPLQRVVETLRIDYGQYWLPDVQPWDSRVQSIGAYCRAMELQWTNDDGATWHHFTPNPSEFQGTLTALSREAFLEYLSRDDWLALPQVATSFPTGSVALALIVRARVLDETQGDLRLAVVETATAAEVAVGEFLKKSPSERAYVRELISNFDSLEKQAQFSVIASAVVGVERSVLVAAVPAWEFRHKVVHEGWGPGEPDMTPVRDAIANLQRATAAVLGRSYRVVAGSGQAVMTAERWEQLRGESDGISG